MITYANYDMYASGLESGHTYDHTAYIAKGPVALCKQPVALCSLLHPTHPEHPHPSIIEDIVLSL